MKNKKGSGSDSDVGLPEQEGRSRRARDGMTRRAGGGGVAIPMANGDVSKGEFVGQEAQPRAQVKSDSRRRKRFPGSEPSGNRAGGGGGGGGSGGKKEESTSRDDLRGGKSLQQQQQGNLAGTGQPSGEWRGYMYMGFLAIQYGMQPILCTHFTDKQVITTSMVLSCEVVKILCAVVLVTFEGKAMELVRQWTLRDSLTCSALPAAIYALQNYLIQIAYRNLDFLSFTMLNQTKLLFTAFFMFMLLRHKQSLPQMGALMLMVVAAVMLTIGQATPSTLSLAGLNNLRKGALSVPMYFSKVLLDTKSLYTGVIPVLCASVLSGLASTLCQMAMQNKGRNTYLMTVEMSLAGSLVLLFSMLQSPDGEKIRRQGFFYAWEKTTMIPVVSNAFGGILVGVVTKYVGGVKKGFAIVSALIVTGIGQVVIDGHLPSPFVWASLPLVVGSTLIHTRYPYVKQVKTA